MKKTAYIIIHGYAGGLYETEYLADFLKNKSYDVYPLLLVGHGGAKRDLSNYDYKQWIDSAKEQVKGIEDNYDDFVFMGFSMGGLVCINLIREFKVKKLVTINTPIYFWNIKLIVKNIIYSIKNREFNAVNYYLKSVKKSPFKYMINFLLILNRSKKMFRGLLCKALILQCMDDDTVRSRSAEYIKNSIGENAEIKYYDKGGHLVLLSETKDLVCKDILSFIET